MRNPLGVSSYSFGKLLGPISITMRGTDGKKTAFTWGQDAPQMTLLELPALIREKLGLSMLEICQFHIQDPNPSFIAELKGALDAAGVGVMNMPIDVGDIGEPNEAYREEDLAEIETWIRLAASLGSKMVRVNAGTPLTTHESDPNVVVASLRRLADYAKSYGIRLLTENHGGKSSDPEWLIQILETVGPDLKVLLDVGNFEPLMSVGRARREGKEPPVNTDYTPMFAAVARVAPYAGLVHAKTHEFDDDGKPVGYDVLKALKVVAASGYVGPISIEYEGQGGNNWVNSLRTKRLVEEAFA